MNDEINRNQGMAVSDPKGAISDALHAREVRRLQRQLLCHARQVFFI